MLLVSKLGMAVASTLMIGAGIVGAEKTTSSVSSSPQALSCEIRATDDANAVSLEGLISSDHSVSGTFHLRVVSKSNGGRATINQSGAFAVDQDGQSKVGLVRLGSTAPDYEATMTLNADGKVIECSETAGSPKFI